MTWLREHRASLVLGLLSFLVFAATTARDSQSLDVISADVSAWNIAATGSPWIDDVELPEELETSPIQFYWVQDNAQGHRVVTRSPGVIAAAVPAYFVAQSDEFTDVPGGLMAALLTALALVLMHRALRTRLSPRVALGATLVLGFTTPVWTVSANGMWPHTLTFLGIAGMAWAAATERWWAAGAFGAITIWGRLHTGIVVAALGLLVGLGRRRPAITARVATLSGLGLGAMLWWTHWMYGSWNPRASYGTNDLADSTTAFSVTNQLGLWISPGRGVLVWTPILLILAAALVRSWRDLPDWSRALALGGLTYTVVQGSMQTFTGGDGFYGYRYGLELVISAAPVLAFSFHRAGSLAKALLIPVVALQGTAMLVGAVLDGRELPQDQMWVKNEFAEALMQTWPVGPVVALIILLVLVSALRLWVFRPVERAEPERVGESPQVVVG